MKSEADMQPREQGGEDAISPRAGRRVVVLSYPGGNLLDVAGPVQTFETANRQALASGHWRERPYEVIVASEHGGAVASGAGLSVSTRPISALAAASIDTLIVPGGSPDDRPAALPGLVRWVNRHAGRVRRVCSVCTGAFILAEAGVLDGLRVTTHWKWAARLQAMYPALTVDADPIFIRQGRVWTSAGVTAGIDLTLALVEADLGHRIALAVARELVVFIKRPGGQSQFSIPLNAQHDCGASGFAELHAWMAAHLRDDLRVARLAERAGMSARTFARAYAAAVGRTPARTVESMRFEAACRALEESHAPLKRIAADTGHGTEQNLRRVFLRRLRITPQQYRARFAPRDGALAPYAAVPAGEDAVALEG